VGTVLDDLTGTPVATARVLLVDSLDAAVVWALSDDQGRVVLVAPGPGVFRVYADRIGYDDLLSDTFPLRDTTAVELELRMAPLPVELDPLVITTQLRRTKLEQRGFYRRQENSLGYFFDQTDVEKQKPTLVSNLLRQVPGVDVRRNRFGGTVLLSRRPQGWGGGCPMKVVVDGFALGDADAGFDQWVPPSSVLGIEVYPGAGGVGAPPQYRGLDAGCGLVLVWTR